MVMIKFCLIDIIVMEFIKILNGLRSKFDLRLFMTTFSIHSSVIYNLAGQVVMTPLIATRTEIVSTQSICDK